MCGLDNAHKNTEEANKSAVKASNGNVGNYTLLFFNNIVSHCILSYLADANVGIKPCVFQIIYPMYDQ